MHSAGELGVGLPTQPDERTIYDLASLTKVIGLTSAVMLGVQAHLLDLDAPVQRCVPAFAGAGKDAVTLRHLLTHSSGLPAWRPLFREADTRTAAFALADTTALDTMPGTRMVYSDIGAIVLTQCVELTFGARIDSLLTRGVFEPLQMRDTRYLPPASWTERIAPTENDPWRGHVLRSEVHDENAARLDGVSGHAGLFSSARDLLTFGEGMLAAWHAANRSAADEAPWTSACPPFPLSCQLVEAFSQRQNLVPGSSRALGWDTPSQPSSAGTRLSEQSFGHTGFTGTSIWIDPTRNLVIVLLSNRVHPTRDKATWGTVRGLVADQVAWAVDTAVNR